MRSYSLQVLFKRHYNINALPDKAMAPHSSILAWRISWTEEPGGLQSMGSQTAGYDRLTDTFT